MSKWTYTPFYLRPKFVRVYLLALIISSSLTIIVNALSATVANYYLKQLSDFLTLLVLALLGGLAGCAAHVSFVGGKKD